MNALIIGCGYLGRALAKYWIGHGNHVTGWVRSDTTLSELQADGIQVVVGNVANSEDWKLLRSPFDVVVHCASSSQGGAESYRTVYLEGLQQAIAHAPGAKHLFVSSTSVYGQTDGEWVDEESPAEPTTETGKILRQTEILGLQAGAIVLRVAGIYGPGRGVLFRKFLDGTAVIEGNGLRWMNQVHRDDIVSAIVLLQSNGKGGEIYNVNDDQPCTHLEYYQWLADRLQRPFPPFGPVNLERKRGVTNKRVKNTRLRALGWIPQYPSFREGLAATV